MWIFSIKETKAELSSLPTLFSISPVGISSRGERNNVKCDLKLLHHLTDPEAASRSLKLFLTVGSTGRYIGLSPPTQVPERQNTAITVKGENYKIHASLMKDTGIEMLLSSSAGSHSGLLVSLP